MNLVCLSLSPHPKPELRACSLSWSSAQQARASSRLEEHTHVLPALLFPGGKLSSLLLAENPRVLCGIYTHIMTETFLGAMQTSAPCSKSHGQADNFSLVTPLGSRHVPGRFCSGGLQPHPSSRREHRGIFVCWACHRLRLGERRSSSSSGDDPDFKENLKTTIMVTSRPRTAPALDWDRVSVPPVQPGRQEEAAAPEALTHSSASPGPAQHAVNSPLLLVAQNSGMKCSAGAQGARSPQVSRQPWRSGHRWAQLPVPLQASPGLWKGVSPLWYNIGYVDITQTVHIGSVYA